MRGELSLVTGATGTVGPTLVNALLAQGVQVRLLSRHPVSPGLFPDSVEPITGDITDPGAISTALAGVSVLFHLAAKLHVANPTPEMRAEYERVNVEGTRVLVEAAQAAGARRVVLFSTVSVYGPTGLEPVDENSPPHPDTIYAETKLRAEEIALSARDLNSGEPLAAVLRMAAIYGPRMKGNYATLVNALSRRRFLPVGNGKNLRTLIFDRDAVTAAVLAARHPFAAGQIFNVSDGSVHSLRDIIAAICAAMGRRPPRGFVPLGAARLAAAAADSALAVTGRSPRLTKVVDKFTETVAVRADRIQQELGFQPKYDLKRGWQETTRDLRRKPASPSQDHHRYRLFQ